MSCSQCQTPFLEKAPCYTVLLQHTMGFQRQDLCQNCWETSGASQNRDRAGVISLWQGTYELPAPPPVDPLPKEDAESMLRKMLERNDPAELEARYILAVMLERKRLLKQRETEKSADGLMIYEYVKTGEVIIVHDPKLRLDQLQEVQRKVAAMLKPAAPVVAAAEAPSSEVGAP